MIEEKNEKIASINLTGLVNSSRKSENKLVIESHEYEIKPRISIVKQISKIKAKV